MGPLHKGSTVHLICCPCVAIHIIMHAFVKPFLACSPCQIIHINNLFFMTHPFPFLIQMCKHHILPLVFA